MRRLDRSRDVREVKARRRGAALELAGVERSRQVLGDLTEQALLAVGLGLLDPVPVAQNLLGGRRLGIAEHVGMAADQLRGAVVGYRCEVPGLALLEEQSQEVDLKQDVAELVEELGVVVPLSRVGELVCLLDRVRDDRALILLAVPGAFLAQPSSDRVQPGDRLGAGARGLTHPPGVVLVELFGAL